MIMSQLHCPLLGGGLQTGSDGDENERGDDSMGSNRRITHGACLLLLIALLPSVATATPPCIAYGYSMAENEPHYSMLVEDSYVFGNELIVVSNCNNTTVLIDGNFQASSSGKKVNTFVSNGIHDVTFRNDGFEQTIRNVTFIQGGELNRVISQLPNEFNPYSMPYTPSEIDSIELVSGIGAILLSWIIVTGFMWKLIKNYNDRNYVMEVN